MDLTHLLINSPKPGARVEAKKTVEDIESFKNEIEIGTGVWSNDLLYSTSHHSTTSQQHQSPYQMSQHSFAATDLLDFQEQPQRHRSTPVSLHLTQNKVRQLLN